MILWWRDADGKWSIVFEVHEINKIFFFGKHVFKWLWEIQVNTYFLRSYVLMGFVLD